ncbi:hypothetical protein ACFWF7_35585 [Nocardia sp. NPDC060256]|uniref:hypothetical protein n=1 Tax=unclassified Nocardia TaxID=2637762 RepID=UPI003668B787
MDEENLRKREKYLRKRFGERVFHLRKQVLGLTMDAVSERDGLSPQRQVTLEDGSGPNPTSASFAKIEKSLQLKSGTARESFFGDTDLVRIGEPVYTAQEVADLLETQRASIELQQVLTAKGLTNWAARGLTAGGGGGLTLSYDAIIELTETLRKLPDPRRE